MTQPPLDISRELARARQTANIEDLERAPDGVPHRIVALTAMFCVMFAALGVVLFATGGMAGRIAAVMLGLVGFPVFVGLMSRRAIGTRDRVHPSR
jgi:hypothetical protein